MNPDARDDAGTILESVGRYYAERLAEHGTGPRGVDWNGPQSHALRHAQFLRLLGEDREASVLDYGCGYGDFLGYLRANGYRGRYIGIDLAPEMIAAARRAHGDGPDREWRIGAEPGDKVCDYAVASGVLNVRGEVGPEAWAAYAEDVVARLAGSSRKGFGYNVLSLSSDPERRRPHLHYADPAESLRRCLDAYGRQVAVMQDYGLWEFTVLVRHT